MLAVYSIRSGSLTVQIRACQDLGADGLNGQHNGPAFARVVASSGITELRTAYRAPRQNATYERFLGSVRRECLALSWPVRLSREGFWRSAVWTARKPSRMY